MAVLRFGLAVLICGASAAAAFAQGERLERVVAEAVAGRVHMLSGGGGANVSVLVGRNRALLVDSKGPAVTDQIVTLVRGLSGGSVAYVLNGHVHPDHTDGNANFGAAGAVIVAHEQVREILSAGQRGGPPSPQAAWPVLTFPDSGGLTLHFDGETVRIFHAPPAHSHDNSIVHFVNANVLHLGDLYGPSRYPVIAGGTIDGFIAAADAALGLADPATRIVPGVGAVTGPAELRAYRDMLATVRERVASAIADGATLEAVVASQPTRGFDATYGDPGHRLFLPVIYAQLSAR